MITPTPGIPRPVTNDPKKVADAAKSAYQASEIKAKQEKEKRDKQVRIKDWEGHLRSDSEELRAQENTLLKLKIQINKIASQPQTTFASNYSATANIEIFERQTAAKIQADEKEMQNLEGEVSGLDREIQTKKQSLVQKKLQTQQMIQQQEQKQGQSEKERGQQLAEIEQTEKKDLVLIAKLEEEIKQKNLELERIKAEHQKLEQDILQLKNQPKVSGAAKIQEQSGLDGLIEQNIRKVTDKRKRIEILVREIEILRRDLGVNKQEAEKANKTELARKDQERKQKQLIEGTKEQLATSLKLVENRIISLKEHIKMYEDNIRAAK